MSRRGISERVAGWFRHGARTSARQGAAILLDRRRFDEARTLLRTYYAILFFLAVGAVYSWPGHLAESDPIPRWPIAWLEWVDLETGVRAILWLHLVGGLAALVVPHLRAARVFVCVTLLWYLSFKFSFGSINHGDHLGLLLSFLLVFLPRGWTSPEAERETRVSTLLVFSASQGLILLIYSMSGLWKVVGIGRQLFAGETSYLSPSGMSQLIAAKLLGADAMPPLGPWMIEQQWLGWPLGLAAIYVEVVAIQILFRPRLHRLWGLGLIAIHLVALLTMGVGFVQNTLWLAVFLVLSPFYPRGPHLRSTLVELPLLGPLFERLDRLRR